MLYRTITLEMIRERPELYEQLRSSKRLLPAMDAYAAELRAAHKVWMETIAWERPGGDPRQVGAEALELAIREMRGRLPSGSTEGEAGSPDATTTLTHPGTPPE